MVSMEERIEEKLKGVFSPSHLKVVNLSHLHAGHAGDDGSGESHFSLEIVSKSFRSLGRVASQRLVFQALEDEMKIIHSLAISKCSDK